MKHGFRAELDRYRTYFTAMAVPVWTTVMRPVPGPAPPPPPPLLLLPLLLLWLRVPPGDASTAGYYEALVRYGQALNHDHCRPVVHGNSSHESWPSSNSSDPQVADSLLFVTDVPEESKYGYGRLTVVQDPLRTISVLEPGGPGGCSFNQRESVEKTAKSSGCLFAQNAGFFDMATGQCLGNVVSDGRMVQLNGGVQNAQFGIRKDGTLVFGYLSEEDVKDRSNPFVQLVTGAVWLLRNGEVYINESLDIECGQIQGTGNLREFVDVLSARTAVGHDAEGKLVLFHCEGQTGVRGMSLWEVADFMKKNGVINAINLDGGGSSTFVINGTLSSYPTDHCVPDGRWRCARQVSTVLCVHPRHCQPPDCSGHGDCVDGRCRCQRGWKGVACDALVCQPADCGVHGVCTADGCFCSTGWRGPNCSEECLEGFYGDGCNQTCACANGASCDPVHGHCICPPGFQGNTCAEGCTLGFFGVGCSQKCRCDDHCLCDSQTGSCNATLPPEHNNRAGQCLAKELMSMWRQQEEPYLSERTWLIISLSLAFLLSFSLTFHLIPVCRTVATAHRAQRQDFSYIPLSGIGGAASPAEVPESGTGDDSDSEEEMWCGSRMET